MALSIPDRPSTFPQSRSPWVSVFAHGATRDPTRDSTDAIARAFERAGELARRPYTSGSPPTSLVKFPAGGYSIREPIFVPSGVDVAGDGWSSRLEMAGDRRFPALVYGVADPRVGPADRPDLIDLLDRSAAPTRGVRWGFDTRGGLALQGQGIAPAIGRFTDGRRTYWEQTDVFTLSVALVPPPGGFAPRVPILGVGQSCAVNAPRPWCLWSSPRPGWVVLTLATTSGRVVGLATALPLAAPVVRLEFEVDLRRGQASAWINGIQVALEIDGLAPGQALSSNDVWPLHVGRQGFAVATSSEPPTPFVLAGLRLGTTLRYRLGRLGEAQARRDGGPIDDHARFFDRVTDQVGTVGFIPFTDPPAQRWLRWSPGDGLDELLLVMRGAQGGSKPSRLSDLQIWSRGPAVLLGAVLDWRGSNLRLQSETAAAVGSIPLVMSYPITLRDCTLSGGDAAIGLSQALVALRDCKIEGQGRHGIRLRGGSLDASNTFAAFMAPQGRSFLCYQAGGEGDAVIRLERTVLDYEDRGPAVALVEVEPEVQHPTTLRIVDLSAALTGPTAEDPRPIVRLGRSWPGVPARATLDGLISGPSAGDFAGGEGWAIRRVDSAIDPA